MAKREQIAKLVGVMAAAYPHAQVTEQTIEVYCRILRDLPFEELSLAAEQCLAESRFMPTIAELRGKVLELRRLADDAPSAFEAWQQVATAARGSYADAWHDRIDQAVMQLMGASTPGQAMRLLGRATADEMVSHRARFIELYDRMEGKSRTQAAMLPEVREAARRILSGQHVALEDRREE